MLKTLGEENGKGGSMSSGTEAKEQGRKKK
jgi:hypothetical protein